MVYHIWYCGSHPRRPRGSYFVPPQLTASWVSEDVWFIAILQKYGIPEGAGVEGLMASFELKFPLLSLDLHDNIYLVFFFFKIRITNYTLPLPSTSVLSKPPVHCLVHSLLAFDSQIFASDHFNKVFSGHRQKVRLFKQTLEIPVHETIDFSFEISLL